MRNLLATVMTLASTCVGCSHETAKQAPVPVKAIQHASETISTEERCVELAKAEFTKNGFALDDYLITVDANDNKKEYQVWFQLKGVPIPGSLHLVIVDAESGKTRFMVGR